MAPELHENYGKVILNTIRRLYRRNSRVTLYKLVQKTHPADMAGVFRYLNPAERRDIFQYIQRMKGLNAFLQEIDHALVPEIFAALSPQGIAATVAGLPPEKLSELLNSFSDEEANTIQTLLDSENREAFSLYK